MSNSIRIVLVDDDKNIHDTIVLLVAEEKDILLVGQAFDGEAGIELCRIAKPDLVLMDVLLPKLTGVEASRAIHAILPETKVLALSSFHEYEQIRAMLDSGAIGYLVKDGLVQDLIMTIRNTMRGNTVLSSEVAQKLLSLASSELQNAQYELSERELEVLKLMANGLTYSGIAHKLRISSPTVRFHINNILEKMRVETRSEALVLAAKQKLI